MVSEPSAIDPLIDEAPSRYVVGIDLGTTNCAVCYVDTSRKPWQARVLKIPQLVARGEIEARETLPSFHYEPPCDAMPDQGLELPWTSSGGDRGKAGRKKPNQRGAKRNAKKTQSDAPANRPRREIDYAVGFMARDEGMLAPGHLIASAKSWLCHTGIDRLAEVLPWHGAPDVQRLSPVEVSARLLMHIRDAWDDRHPSNKLADQDIVVTLPASFDEVARELTIEAAARAGLRRVVLIEEPQAAFYAWLDKHSDTWQQQVRAGQNILVCDIGGGTTDFTLIQARPAERQTTESQDIQFHRVAVGDHLILGGDNLDLALAQYVEQRLTGGSQLPKRQWGVLVRSCRHMKEILLADDAPASYQMNLPGGGSKVIGGSMQIEISKDEIHNLLLEGFLPRVKLDARPQQRQSGFQEFGLPYAPDPAITRYLAEFLTAHCRQEPEQEPRLADGETADGKKAAGREAARKAKVARTKSRTKSQKKSQTISSGAKSSQEVLSQTVSAATDPRSAATPAVARPDIILLNGGFFASPVLRQRLLDVVRSWFVPRNNSTWSPLILENDRLDMAVARGAAYYGMVRRGKGVRIRANLARSYYIRVDGPEPSAVCLAPGSAEAGQDIALENRTFELLVSQPVEFPLYVSSTRLTDPPGRIVPINLEQMTALPPIRTVLKT